MEKEKEFGSWQEAIERKLDDLISVVSNLRERVEAIEERIEVVSGFRERVEAIEPVIEGIRDWLSAHDAEDVAREEQTFER
jgi:hypothetical protein